MSVTQASRRDMSVSHGVSHTTPTRPDPTRPLSSGEPFHHNVAVGNARGSGDVVVSATRIDESTDLTTIEHLDFQPEILMPLSRTLRITRWLR